MEMKGSNNMNDSRNIKPVALKQHVQKKTRVLQRYTKEDFEKEVYGADFNKLKDILMYKKNMILQGAPGVGKTYCSDRLCWAIMGEKDNSRITKVQFHQSYTYDDFVIGLRPTETGGFKFEEGSFYNVCKQAEKDKEHMYFMLIDEINRGNMSKILGELFSLIESDHRDEEITLKYRNEKFMVPSNLYIIGTMNTADRGLVMLDYALRRRFAFVDIEPAFESDGFRQFKNSMSNLRLNKLIKRIIELNIDISKDELLGKGFQIGHSYFCKGRKLTDEELMQIVEYEIAPLLNEYWYDDPDKKNEYWIDRLKTALE